MTYEYKPLIQSDNDQEATRRYERLQYRQSKVSACYMILLLLLFVLNGSLWVYYSFVWNLESIPTGYAITEDVDIEWARFWWHTDYSPRNHTDANALWEAILPSHGFVAMDLEWAKEHQWPTTMYLPSDHSKGVFLLEAYHQLHCLRIMRKTFWEAVEGKPYTYKELGHIDHCFDTLRQSIMCNADNTPLYTFGDNTAGNGQLHKCRNWDQLRQFATNNRACYRDSVEGIPLGEHFGYCDEGSDGLDSLTA